MSLSKRNPTLIFVPGAWHLPAAWSKVTSILSSSAHGFKCLTPALPSVSSNVKITLLEDIAAIRNPIFSETTAGRDVVLIVHSYGGVVGESAIKGLAPPKEGEVKREGEGHIIGLVMIATGFMPTGLSFLSHTGGAPPPFWKIEDGIAVLTADTRELFYHDLPQEEGEYWVSQLQPQAVQPLNDSDVYAGWKDVPVWYLITVEDKALPAAAQKFFVEDSRGKGASVVSREVESGHSPMLSRPEETAVFVVEAVQAFTGSKA